MFLAGKIEIYPIFLKESIITEKEWMINTKGRLEKKVILKK